MQEFFVDKIHIWKFLCISDKPRLHQLNIITSSRCSTVQASLTAWILSFVWGNTIKKGKYPVLRTNTKPHQPIKLAKISYSIVSLVFRKCSYRTYQWSKPGASKLRYSEYLKKYKKCKFHTFCWESTFWYTLAQHVVPQKFIYVSKITGHHFPGWV